MSDPSNWCPGWEGSQGPFRGDYIQTHVYARDIHSGAGNCVCGSGLGDWVHVMAAPGVPMPPSQRYGTCPERLWPNYDALHIQRG